MKSKANTTIRVFFGLAMLIFGFNKIYIFITPPPQPLEAREFIRMLYDSGYLMHLTAVIEMTGGILLLINRYVGIASVILLPVTVNIFLFHLFLDRMGLPAGVLVLFMNIWMIYLNNEKYKALLS